MKIAYKNSEGQYIEAEIKNFSRILLIDSNDVHYELRENRFDGVELMAIDGAISIEPCVSNHIVVKTRM